MNNLLLTHTTRAVSARFVAVVTIVSLLLSAFPVAFFVAEAATSVNLTLAAVPNPTGSDTDFEYVTISNTSSHDVDLTGWKLVEAGTELALSGTLTGPGDLVACANVAFEANGGKTCEWDFPGGFDLVNTGGSVSLVAPDGAIVVTVSWGDVSSTESLVAISESGVYTYPETDVESVVRDDVDLCDPSQRPAGLSIAQWHEANNFDGSSCFDTVPTDQCGLFDSPLADYQLPSGFEFRYVLGTETPDIANFQGDGALPVSFDEDENGGSVDITYYLIGPESDFVEGSGFPNIWDGNGKTVTVDTDCEGDVPPLEIPEQCSVMVDEFRVPANSAAGSDSNVVLTEGGEYFAVVEGTYTFGTPKDGNDRVADAEYSLEAGDTEWKKEFAVDRPDVLDLFIDGVNPDFGAFRADHTYGTFFTGTGAVSNFAVNDNPYNDNTGTLDVTIYECERPKPPVCEIGENLLKNGSFEEPVVTDSQKWRYTSIVDWAITALSDGEEQDGELHNGWEGNQAADGEQYAELDSRESVKMSQTVATIPGATYELKWAFAPRHNTDATENQLAVYVNGGTAVATEGPASLPAGLNPTDWTRNSYTFTATGDETAISFADAGATSDTFGTFLDDTALCFVSEPAEPETYTIRGHKWNDLNGDGNWDKETERGIPGWTIYLRTDDSVSTTTTVDEGYYEFEVSAGGYVVREAQREDWVQTAPATNGGDCHYAFYDEVPLRPAAENGLSNPKECNFGNQFVGDDGDDDVNDTDGDGSITGTRLVRPAARVAGAATTSICPLLNDHMQIGWENNPWEVIKLQLFLSIAMGYDNPITGIFDRATDRNVKAFQEVYHDEILKPWFDAGVVPHDRPTGFVYKTTKWKINDIVCPGDPFPSLDGENLSVNIDIDHNGN
jgi:hypothetical protein